MRIVLADETRTALDSDAVITTLPEWNAFADFRGLLIDLPGNDLGIRGVLTSLTPEPDSLVLLCLGAVFFVRKRTYRRG
jgi:hypothetical protein